MYISNIFKKGELGKSMVCKDFLHTTQHGAIAGKTTGESDQAIQPGCNYFRWLPRYGYFGASPWISEISNLRNNESESSCRICQIYNLHLWIV